MLGRLFDVGQELGHGRGDEVWTSGAVPGAPGHGARALALGHSLGHLARRSRGVWSVGRAPWRRQKTSLGTGELRRGSPRVQAA